ncbi:MAG: formylglycine-generating enzyme family protein [bacterium]|nr:formylglycine-generating enzyme family protein [bacterium]
MKNTILALFLIVPFFARSTDVNIGEIEFSNDSSSILIPVSWKNAWNNNRNHDAVWFFMKLDGKGREASHWKISNSAIKLVESNTQLSIKASSDNLGVYISAASDYRGDISCSLQIDIDKEELRYSPKSINEVWAFGIEMVYVPEGQFVLGEPGNAVLDFGGLFKSDEKGEPAGLISITSEGQVIEIAPKKDALYYKTKRGYEGDQQGTIPASFPNGYSPFYIMKYEPTQGQYVDFLNTLTEQQSHHRANFAGKTYYDRRGSISIKNNVYVAELPNRPCNYMSWDDAMAYADWAGLRPMTELEFVKAARGPETPITNQFPWGTDSYENMQRNMQQNGNVEMEDGSDESELSDDTREKYGASYYWVMDLAGSMWERVITIGHEKGRSFKGVHGDGNLNNYGFADVDDWPSGVKSKGGFGFRGGGYYVYPMNFTEFNPYSPIAYRRYGGWAGGNRKEAYGARFVRSAD